MTSADASTTAKQARRTLNIYVSETVRRRVSTNVSDETIQGSVLFLDIVDSTGLTERYAALGPQGPEQLAGLLDDYFGTIFALIAEFGGDVTGMDGDSVIALWRDEDGGVPAGQRADAAAFALKECLGNYTAAELHQRIVVTEGPIRIIQLAPASSRQLLVLSGEPLRAIEPALMDCAPDQVRVSNYSRPHDLKRIPTRAAASVPDRADEVLAPFLPRFYVDRVANLHGGRIAEFRTLTSVMVRLDGTVTDLATFLHRATATIQRELADIGLTIFDLLILEKGTVVKFITGLPGYSMENNASAAIEAARRILAALAQDGIDAGIGVATGRAFVGEIGSESRRVLATIGPAMSRSARLMQVARAQILCDPATVAQIGDRFAFGDVIPMTFKGSVAPQMVRQVLGPASTHRMVANTGEMFGRDSEIAMLEASLRRLVHGAGGLVVIEAEAGLGKSKLLSYGQTLAQQHGYRNLFSAAQALEEQTPYFAFRQVLAQLLDRENGWQMDPKHATQRLVEMLQDDPLLVRAEVLTDVLPLHSAPFASWRRLTGAARPSAISDLFVTLLRNKEDGPPPVLLLDDVHWLDASSMRLLSGLLRRVPGFLVIIASRPPDAHGGAELRYLLDLAQQRLVLERLNRKATGDLVRATLSIAAIPRRLIDYIYDRSDGLPLHAEQLTLAMLELGLIKPSLSGARADFDVGAEGAEVETLRDVIVRRLDMLPLAQQDLLRVASVLGRSFDATLLHAMHPDAPERAWADEQLALLEQGSLIGREGERIAFRHIRIQEVVYDLLSFQYRRALHHRAARAIEAVYMDDINPHCGQLAAHWEHAGESVRGASYRMRAAARALDTHAHDEVLAHLRMIERQGGHAALLATNTERAEFARIFGMASEELGKFGEARRWLAQCAALSGISVRSGRIAVVVGIGAEALRQLGMRCGAQLRSQAAAACRDALSAQVHLRFAEHAYYEGDAARLLEVTLTALNRAESGAAFRELATSSGSFALGLGVAGFNRLADFYGNRAMEVGRAANLWEYGMAHLLNAVRLFATADWRAVEAMTAGGANIFRELGERDRYASCQLMAAFARIAQCDLQGALQLVDEFGEYAEDIDNAAMRDFALVARSLVELLSGQSTDRAAARLREIRGDRLSAGELVLCRGIEAAAALASGDASHARTTANLALALTERHLPSISIAYHGVVGMAVTQQALAAISPSDAAGRASAARSMRLLRSFARRMPVSRPYADWLVGRVELKGRPRRATKLLLRGLRSAERLAMPVEMALCHRALAAAGHSPSIHTKAAEAILDHTAAHAWIDSLLR